MNLNLTGATRIGVNVVVLLGAIVALRLGESIFIPLVIAALLASILWPSAIRLHDYYHLPWPLACAGAVLVLIILNLVVTLGFVMAVPRLLQDLPRDAVKQQELYDKFRNRVDAISPLPLDPKYFPEQAVDSVAFKYVQDFISGPYVTNAIVNFTGYVGKWLFEFVLILFILLFLLMEGRMLMRRVTEVFGPSADVRSKVVATLTEMTTAVRSYLIWRTVINIGLAIVIGAIFQAMGLHQGWTWGLLAGVLSYIPYIGPIIAGIPPLVDAFVHLSPWHALAVLFIYATIVTLEGYLIVPLVMGRHMDLNATTVMLACLFWDLVWGIPGLFLAMPLMAAVKAICEHVPGWKPWANLMSADEDKPGATVLSGKSFESIQIAPPLLDGPDDRKHPEVHPHKSDVPGAGS
jgi:predicted PurR-regulated permease PerM